MSNSKAQSFGSSWTEKKLDAVMSYITSWNTILSKYPYFDRIYIDAFAGSGEREDNGVRYLGSPLRVMQQQTPFDKHYFIDGNEGNCVSLRNHLKKEINNGSVSVIHSDANTWIKENLSKFNWKKTRAVMFLDPFAMQLDYSTLELIAKESEGLDLWMLFPSSALIRTLPNSNMPPKEWWTKLDKFWGNDSWKDLYKAPEVQQLGLEGLLENPEGNSDSSTPQIRDHYVEVLDNFSDRLAEIFPATCNEYGSLMNKNHLLFILFFVTTAPKRSAQAAAKKIANHLMKKINNSTS